MERVAFGDVVVWRFSHLAAQAGVVHGVTARHGGVSEGPYASLNLGLHVGDDPAAVVTNRRRLCVALGVDFDQLTLSAQVHGAELAEVGTEQIGAGRAEIGDAVAGVDGLVVRRPGVTVAVLSADCVPLLMYDPRQHLGAAVHAGWRGTAAGMAVRAVRFLAERMGSDPADLLVGIGPCIGGCCYQVSERVASLLADSFAYSTPIAVETPRGWYADLAAANREQLLGAGVAAAQLESADLCTSCHAEEFFSERKLGRPTGRLGAALGLGSRE